MRNIILLVSKYKTVYPFYVTDKLLLLLLLLFLILSHFYVGSMCLMTRLHFARSCVFSPNISLSDKSLLMLSNHLRFGLPLLRFPRHLHRHHSLAYVFVFTSQYMPIPLHPTFIPLANKQRYCSTYIMLSSEKIACSAYSFSVVFTFLAQLRFPP